MTAAKMIAKRIEGAPPGTVFVPSDFHDISSVDNTNAVLSRMTRKGEIMRAVRGVYAKPKHIAILNEDVPPSPDAIAYAIARNNRWRIAPSGNTALNRLGLDTQIPAVYEYVSSGPYKTYQYGKFTIRLRHRANRDLLECSSTTCLVIQALKELGKESADHGLARQLADKLSCDDIMRFYDETRGTTAWVFEFAKMLREEKGC